MARGSRKRSVDSIVISVGGLPFPVVVFYCVLQEGVQHHIRHQEACGSLLALDVDVDSVFEPSFDEFHCAADKLELALDCNPRRSVLRQSHT
jgi:hypothetical protein